MLYAYTTFYFISTKKMIGSGAILTNGVTTFAPVFTRLWEIAQEFVPYFIYIAISALGISLLWKAVKYIIGYLAGRSKRVVRGR